MILNMSGGNASVGSGSGAGLNFKIVGGTTQPTNPVENTLWVETSVEINSWSFGFRQPEGIEGKIWIQDLASGQLTFNMLEKNSIILSPSYCQQYVGGQWVEKKAYVYKDSSWTRLNRLPVYIYNMGDQCESLTGGWSTWSSSSSGASHSATLESNRIQLTTGYDAKGYTYAGASTKGEVDFDGYNTMTINMETGYPRFTVALGGTGIYSQAGYVAGARDIIIDVSSYSGKYSVGLTSATTWDDIQSGGGDAIYSIKLS